MSIRLLFVALYLIMQRGTPEQLKIEYSVALIVGLDRCVLFLWHKLSKKMDDIEYEGIKKDFYVFRFLFITICTIFLNVVRLGDYETTVKAINGVFAVYIAFDRLNTKFEKVHKND